MALIDLWVDEPESNLIAEMLNAAGALLCPHGRSQCISRCGVQRVFFRYNTVARWRWRPLSQKMRSAFYVHAMRNSTHNLG